MKFVQDLVINDPNNHWMTHSWEVDGIEVEVHYLDTAAWLQSEFSKTAYREGFTLRPVQRMVNGERAWSCPADCDPWLRHQFVIEVEAAGAVVAALQLYSDKSLLNNKGTAVYPLKAVLLNAPYTQRVLTANMQNIAFSPEVKKPKGMSEDAFRRAKLQIHHQVLDLALGPLKELSKSGVEVRNPSGERHWAFPRLCHYCGDDPECKLCAGVYVSGKPEKPCEQCYCPFDQQNKLDLEHPARTVRQQQGIIQAIRAAETVSVAAGKREAAKWSTHAVEKHGLFGFEGEHTEWGNPFLCFGYDNLHTDLLGLWVDLVRNIKAFCDALTEGCGQGRAIGAARWSPS